MLSPKWMDKCCSYQEERVAIPWFCETILLTARQDILTSYGIKPSDIENWESFYSVCAELAAYNRENSSHNDFQFPLAFPVRPEAGNLHHYMAWLWSGGWIFPDLNRIPEKIINTEEFLRTFDYISKLINVCDIAKHDMQVHSQHLYERFYSQGHYVFYLGNWEGIVMEMMNNHRNPERQGCLLLCFLFQAILRQQNHGVEVLYLAFPQGPGIPMPFGKLLSI